MTQDATGVALTSAALVSGKRYEKTDNTAEPMTRTASVVVVLCLSARLLAAAPLVQVNTLDGRTIEGELQTITSEAVAVQTGDTQSKINSAELHSLSLKPMAEPPSTKPSAWVELADGSRVPATSFLSKDGKVTVALTDGAQLAINVKQVRSVRYSKLDDPEAEASASEATGDLLGIRKRDNVDFMEGVIGDVTKEAVHFTVEGQSIPVNPARVDSLVYAKRAADGNAPAPACIVEETSGAELRAKSVELVEGKLRLTLLAGGNVERPLEAVRRLDFSAGRLTYLSDLKPQSVEWTPFFDLGKQSPALAKFLGPRFDRGREDSVMRLDEKEYKRGVSLTSRTKMVYRLPAQSKRFRAVAGIDDGVGNLGSVQLVIQGDDRQLYSGKLGGSDPPVELDLDLAGVRRLTILVDFGDDLDVADHLNLCEARIVK
ncbi:MAG TPA: NPCBM/NEW2 domain-containing protein [Pirellulales bacterium]|nr:NPCBM/NEW2 domain-containing protein [Pirellulales bacterium]